MAAKNKDTQNEKERNYKSRYDDNRHCFRVDETTYVYREYSDDENYTDHTLHVGEDDVTFEILDVLLDSDNAEAQDSEDVRKNADGRFEATVVAAEELAGNAEGGFDFVSASYIDGQPKGNKSGRMNLAGGFTGSPELIGPEAVLFKAESKPWTKDIAAVTLKKNGKPMSESGITKQLRLLRAKIEALMAPHIDW